MNGLKQSGVSQLGFAQKVSSMQHNLAPRLEVQETAFGFYCAAIRDIQEGEQKRTEARIAAYIAPYTVLNPNGDIATFVVPLGDSHTAFFHVFWSNSEALNREPLRTRHLEFIGLSPVVLDAFGLTDDTIGRPDRPNVANNHFQDRVAMRRGESWSGLPGLIEEDVAVSVSSGPIRERAHEVLSVSDVGISRLYRCLLACVAAAERGDAPAGIHFDPATVIATHGVIDGRGWQDLLTQSPKTAAANKKGM
jgi:hypothetical protein